MRFVSAELVGLARSWIMDDKTLIISIIAAAFAIVILVAVEIYSCFAGRKSRLSRKDLLVICSIINIYTIEHRESYYASDVSRILEKLSKVGINKGEING